MGFIQSAMEMVGMKTSELSPSAGASDLKRFTKMLDREREPLKDVKEAEAFKRAFQIMDRNQDARALAELQDTRNLLESQPLLGLHLVRFLCQKDPSLVNDPFLQDLVQKAKWKEEGRGERPDDGDTRKMLRRITLQYVREIFAGASPSAPANDSHQDSEQKAA